MTTQEIIVELDQMRLNSSKYVKSQGQLVPTEATDACDATLKILNALRLAGAKTAEEALALPRKYGECRKRYADMQVKSIVERDCFKRKIADLEEELKRRNSLLAAYSATLNMRNMRPRVESTREGTMLEVYADITDAVERLLILAARK